jgi:inner membrane protein
MDFVTNSLAGLALSRAGFSKVSPRSALLLFFSLNIPDIDYLASLAGPLTRLEQHAGYTHSLLALPLLAILCVALVSITFRERLPWWRAWLLACLGVALHLLGDAMTDYGVRLMLPFSSRWVHLDISPQLDPWILTILGCAMVWPHFSQLVSGEIGAKITTGQGSAWLGLSAVIAFELARALTHQQAISQMETRLYDGAAPLQLAAIPDAGNPLRWTGIVETQNSFRKLPIGTLSTFDSEAGQNFFKLPETAAMRAAKTTAAFHYFLYFSRFPVWTVEPILLANGEGTRVQLTDLRFGNPTDNALASFALEDAAGKILKSWFTFHSADAI